MSTMSVPPRGQPSNALKLFDSSTSVSSPNEFLWDEDLRPADNYRLMGERLAACGDLYAKGGYQYGLFLVWPDGKHEEIAKGTQLAPVIADRVPVRVVKDGKSKGGVIPATHLTSMLSARSFLDQFKPVDCITRVPLYRLDYSLTVPGYNDGGQGCRILHVGGEFKVSESMDTIKRFLKVMEFESNADRTNAVAAALTVELRNHWPGGKPIILATATKSHSGKDTVISFATGHTKSVSVSYESKSWAVERSIVGAIKTNPDAGVIVVENARLERGDQIIASSFLERFATDPEPFLSSPGTGRPVRIRNNIVLAISTNFGSVSEDLLNRSLPIRLHPPGDIAARDPKIGNPKHEFLPQHRQEIAAELRGMIERWKAKGSPLDETVHHPFTLWAKVVGGILKCNDLSDFLANYGTRKTADDPVRHGLGLLGIEKVGEWLRPGDWVREAADVGLIKTLIPEADRENDVSRARGIGVVLSNHAGETFPADTDSRRVLLRLEKKRGRWGGDPEVRYRFVMQSVEDLPIDPEAVAADEAGPGEPAVTARIG